MLSTENIDHVAAEARQRLKLGVDPIPNVHELLESNGIKVCIVESEGNGFDGCSAKTEPDSRPVIVLSKNANLLRMRMTAAHEFAHILLEPLLDGIDENTEEKLVTLFAGAFLLPKETFQLLFGSQRNHFGLGEMINLKVYFGASITAIMMRAADLELISSTAKNRFWQRYGSKWRSAKCEPGDEDYSGTEMHSRFQQLVFRAVAEGMISANQGSSTLGVAMEEFRRRYQTTLI